MHRYLAPSVFLAICAFLLAPAAFAQASAPALFAFEWEWRMQSQPELATRVGDYRYNDRLSDTTLAASRAAIEFRRATLDHASRIARADLAGQEVISFDLFLHEQQMALAESAFHPFQAQPITDRSGLHITLPQLVAQTPFATEADYRAYLARLAALPAHVDGLVEQLAEGIRTGWVAPRVIVEAVPDQLRQMRENLAEGLLAAPFAQIPANIGAPQRAALAAAGTQALNEHAAPALQTLEDFMRATYLPAARASIAASALPGGPAYYEFKVRQATGTNMTPQEVHGLGIREVARIQGEMHATMLRTGFRGTYPAFVKFINSDPRFFYTQPEQLLASYRRTIARVTPRLPALFDPVPAQALVVKPIQQAGARHQGPAYYEAGAPDRPAALVVNTSRLEARPKWEIDTLALHEAVPGHHLQTARAHEIAALPPFRRYGWHIGFGEGWALYAETLGPELGLLRDQFSRFGQLNSELLRAARLVADTGIHAFGWSRAQALEYLAANTANPAADNAVEVDGYIGAPGQALGYKVGQLKIAALRAKAQAQAALGARFDMRRFHGAVIDNGPLPLFMVEQQVEAWIARETKPAAN